MKKKIIVLFLFVVLLIVGLFFIIKFVNKEYKIEEITINIGNEKIYGVL